MNVISKDSLYYADTYFLPTTLVIISTNLAVGMQQAVFCLSDLFFFSFFFDRFVLFLLFKIGYYPPSLSPPLLQGCEQIIIHKYSSINNMYMFVWSRLSAINSRTKSLQQKIVKYDHLIAAYIDILPQSHSCQAHLDMNGVSICNVCSSILSDIHILVTCSTFPLISILFIYFKVYKYITIL